MAATLDRFSPFCSHFDEPEESDDQCLYGIDCCLAEDGPHDISECHTHLTMDYAQILHVQEGH